MTTVYNLPEEILFMIFSDLESDDLLECHTVCRAWYSAAHVIILNEVTLTEVDKVLQFIGSFDRNPDPIYLKAVKKLTIQDLDDDDKYDQDGRSGGGFQFGKENLRKLFFRFPKLEQVMFYDSLHILGEFDNGIREMFQQIGTFEVDVTHQNSANYHVLVKSLRHLITSINIRKTEADVHIRREFGGPVEFISGFPRLQEIQSDYSLKFQQWLPIFQQLPNLTTIDTFAGEDDEDTFVERFISAKPQDERTVLIERLSEIQSLTYSSGHTFNLNSIQFISKFLTGLTYLSIDCSLDRRWRNSQQRLFCEIVSDLAYSINHCTLDIKLEQPVLQEYLPTIINKVFQQKASSNHESTPNRCLQLDVESSADSTSLSIVSTKEERSIGISFNQSDTIDVIGDKIFKSDIPLHDVDEFTLTLDDHYTVPVSMEMYDIYLKIFPSVKKISLEIPESFTDSETSSRLSRFTLHRPLHLLEEMTIRADQEVRCQAFLNECYDRCPNLKQLNLYQFSGSWKDYIGEYQLELPKFTLETLVIDVASMTAFQECNEDYEEDFFVVEMDYISNGEKRQLYKVDIDLDTITEIVDEDLKGLTRGEHYEKLRIVIKELQTLTLVNLKGERDVVIDLDEWPSITLCINEDE